MKSEPLSYPNIKSSHVLNGRHVLLCLQSWKKRVKLDKKIHTSYRPLDCPFCNFFFTQSGVLTSHIIFLVEQRPLSILYVGIYLSGTTHVREGLVLLVFFLAHGISDDSVYWPWLWPILNFNMIIMSFNLFEEHINIGLYFCWEEWSALI